MRVCAICNASNPDERDFCASCGEYLRWDPTTVVPAVQPDGAPEDGAAEGTGDAPTAEIAQTGDAEATTARGPAAPGDGVAAAPPDGAPGDGRGRSPVAAVASEPVLLTMRLPDADGPPATGGLATTVDAGGQTSLVALVRNQSGIVDNYDLSVAGFHEQWWTITPPTVYLVPYGSPGGTYEQEATVSFTPPRSPEAEARPWPVEVVATSRARNSEAARSPATVVISPYQELQTEMRPQRGAGRRRINYAVGVRNRGNAPADVEVAGLDDEEALRFEFERQRFLTNPGKRGGSKFTVRPRRQIWVGRALEHRFEVTPRALTAPAPEQPVQGFLRQRPWVPYWALLVIPLIAAGVVALIALWPEGGPGQVAVPDLTRSADLLGAQALLDSAGLTLGNRYSKPAGTNAPGTIVSQTPAPGSQVDKGSAVAVNVATGAGAARIKIPKLIGLTLPQADKLLLKRKLQIGKMLSDPKGKGARIGFQAPEPGTKAHAGDAVDIDFKAAPAKVPGAAPAVAGLAVPAAAAALAKDKVPYVVTKELSPTVEAGQLIAQVPAAGAKVPKGGHLQLIVSAGNPWIAFDNDRDMLLMGAAVGTPVQPLAATADVETQPAFSPNGNLVAYRRTPAGTPQPVLPTSPGRIWVANVKTGKQRPLTDAGFDDRRPAFSPDGTVVAFIANRPAKTRDFNLCFQRIQPIRLTPECVPGAAYSVSRPAWSPDGRAILLDAEQLGSGRSELLLYTSSRANSPAPATWTVRGIVTAAMHVARPNDQVRSIAWSPDGKRVAFSANWQRGIYRLYMSKVIGHRLAMAKPVGTLTACELSWSPTDLGQLVVSQRDRTTCEGPGQILRVDPGDPKHPTVISPVGVGDPSWQPVLTAGG